MKQVEFRLARRYGELIYQRRYVTTKLTRTSPWWKIWDYTYHTDRTYGNWADIPIPEISEEELEANRKELVECQKYYGKLNETK